MSSSGIIRWDTGDLHGVHRQIEKELDKLKKEKIYLMNFADKLQSSWQTPVGELFDFHFQDYLMNLETVIESLDKHQKGLKAIRIRYSQCEGDIESKMNKLSI